MYQKRKDQYKDEDIPSLNHHIASHLLVDVFDLPSSLIPFFLSCAVSSVADGDRERLLTEMDYKRCVRFQSLSRSFYESHLQHRSQIEQCFFLVASSVFYETSSLIPETRSLWTPFTNSSHV